MRLKRAAAVVLGFVLVQGVVSMGQRRVITDGTPATGPYSPAVVAGGLVYVSGLLGLEPAGSAAESSISGISGISGIGAQTRRVLERMKATLAAAGSSLAQVVNVNVYVKTAADFDAMNAVYREFFAEKPPARTTVVADLPAGALVEMSAIALPDGAPRETMLPAGWMKSPRPYSYIVRAGDLVFFAGLVSRRGTDDQVVAGSTALQVKTILENAKTLLRTADLTLDDVVAARVFITDDLYFDEMNSEYLKYFRVDPPARATAVAGLMGVDARVEIALVATSADREVLGPLLSPTLPVSTAIRAGNRVFLSGVLGNTDANRDNLPAQTREVLTRIGRTLETAGLSFADVVDTTVYATDLWQAGKIDDVYREFFSKNLPARTMVGAKLVSRAGLVEMMMTAVK